MDTKNSLQLAVPISLRCSANGQNEGLQLDCLVPGAIW